MFCLQEVWLSESQLKIRDGVHSVYPYIVTAAELSQGISDADTFPACDFYSLELFEECSAIHCPSVGFNIYCMTENCLPTLRQLPRYCLACLLFGPPHGQSCLTTPAAQYWPTSSGLMLLSKRKLADVQVESFLPDPLAQHHGAIRGYIQAQVTVAIGPDSFISIPCDVTDGC